MEQRVGKRRGLRDAAPVRLAATLLAVCAAAAIQILRQYPEAMRWVFYHISRPYHSFMSRLWSHVPFSGAELFYAAVICFIIVYIIYQIIHMIQCERRWHRVYITVLTLAMTASLFWAGICVMWSPYYFAPTFCETGGVSDDAVSVEELEAVTRYFAALAGEYGEKVTRDEDGLFCVDRNDILDRAADAFGSACALFPSLEGQELRPKGIICSKVMSLLDFTGFFFPLTGEANVNMDSPACSLPATAEHEIAHQRGVAEEQECNFVAVLVCMESGYDDYAYSGALLAYTYLGNALYGADRDAWSEVYGTLTAGVRADLSDVSAYWAGYRDTFTQKTSNTVYDSFLKSNGQELGRQSYGACVDLLVNYYLDMA